MKKLFLASVVSLLFHATLPAQTSAGHKAVFQSINAIGLLNGSTGSSFMLQSSAGYRIKPIFVGLGAGLDLYKYRSVPVFADLRYELGKKKKNLFLFGNAGYSIPWLTQPEKTQLAFPGTSIKSSWYYDAGAGYRIKFNKNALLFSAGYSYKEFRAKASEYLCTLTSCGVTDARYRYHLPRLVVKAGFQF